MKNMNNRETFRTIFKIIILFQLYSYLKFTAEATQLSHTKKNVAQFGENDGNNLNDRMSQIEGKSQHQEKEIYLLKTTVVEYKRTIRQLRGRVSSLESLMLTSNSETYEKLISRQKRPYRLLPLQPASGEVKDKTENDKAAGTRFFGPPSNCNELGKLGYTLNGYYLVKGKGESLSNGIEAVLCQFKLPKDFQGTDEERLGFVTIGKNLENSQRLGATDGMASPRRANLVNGFGKCVNVDPLTHSGVGLQQSNCDPNDKTMLWSWNEVSLGSKDRHICNGHGKCVATPSNSANNALQIAFHHYDEHAQRFNLLDSLAHPGFYVIKNDHGKCLSVQGNTNQTGAQIWSNDCNPLEEGQRWNWRKM